MRIELHKLVASDITRIMEYYEDVAGPQLADEFYDELRVFFQKAVESPEGYEIRQFALRRVNLERFPYIISFIGSLTTQFAFSLFVTTAVGHR